MTLTPVRDHINNLMTSDGPQSNVVERAVGRLTQNASHIARFAMSILRDKLTWIVLVAVPFAVFMLTGSISLLVRKGDFLAAQQVSLDWLGWAIIAGSVYCGGYHAGRVKVVARIHLGVSSKAAIATLSSLVLVAAAVAFSLTFGVLVVGGAPALASEVRYSGYALFIVLMGAVILSAAASFVTCWLAKSKTMELAGICGLLLLAFTVIGAVGHHDPTANGLSGSFLAFVSQVSIQAPSSSAQHIPALHTLIAIVGVSIAVLGGAVSMLSLSRK